MRVPASIPAAAAALGCFAFASPAMAADAVVDVPSERFTPSQVTINAGEKVTWTFNDGGHNAFGTGDEQFDSREGAGGKNNPSGSSWSHTFSKAGSFDYVCTEHGGMQGTVIVKSVPASQPPPSGGGGTGGGGSTGGGGTTGGGGSTSGGGGTTSGGGGTTSGGGTANSGGGSQTITGAPAPGATLPAAGGAVDSAAPPAVRNRGFNGSTLRLSLSEASKLVVRYVRVGAGGHKVHKKVVRGRKGNLALNLNRWMRRGQYRVVVLAFDGGGNMSRPLRLRLNVRR